MEAIPSRDGGTTALHSAATPQIGCPRCHARSDLASGEGLVGAKVFTCRHCGFVFALKRHPA